MKAILLLLSSISCCVACAQSEKHLLVKGNQLYKSGEFEKAAGEYRKAAERNAKNAEAHFNLGNALYKAKKTDEAQKAFDAASETGDKSVMSKSAYNKGVVLTRENKLNESIDAYKESLRRDPLDEEARENLQKAINELKKQQPPPPEPKNNKQDNKPDNKQQPPEKNKSKLTQKRAEQMLNAVRQDEKRLQQEMQKRKARTGGQPDKDW